LHDMAIWLHGMTAIAGTWDCPHCSRIIPHIIVPTEITTALCQWYVYTSFCMSLGSLTDNAHVRYNRCLWYSPADVGPSRLQEHCSETIPTHPIITILRRNTNGSTLVLFSTATERLHIRRGGIHQQPWLERSQYPCSIRVQVEIETINWLGCTDAIPRCVSRRRKWNVTPAAPSPCRVWSPCMYLKRRVRPQQAVGDLLICGLNLFVKNTDFVPPYGTMYVHTKLQSLETQVPGS